MAKQFLPGGLVSNIVNRATFDRESAMRRPTTADIIQARIGRMAGTAPKVPTVAEGAARESRLANTLRAYGLGTPATPTAAAGAALKPSATDTVSELLPSTGTPAMAGLGAAGRTMMQLGGWQDKPYTLGQILGAGAEKGIAAMKAQREAMAAAAEKKAAAERQVGLDELSRRNIESQIKVRETPPAFKPGTLYDFPVEGGTQKGYIDSGGKVVYVGGVKKPTKEGKPSGFVGVYTKEGDFIGNVREDSPEADAYAKKGYKIIESTTISGTKEDVGLGAKAKGAIETDIMDIQESISDLNDISTSWNPRFQTFATRGEAFVKAALEKAGVDLSPDEEKLVGDVAVYKQNAWDAVNAYIKYLTGAQMSEAEARRIMKSFPDPRLGLFEGDSPTEYKRKLDAVLRKARLSLARNAYALSKGLKPKLVTDADPDKNEDNLIFVDEKNRAIGIEQMPHIMRREESRLRKQFANLKKEDLENRVESEMRRIFAIGA